MRDIKEDLIEDDLLTPIDLGNVIHSSMENLYKNYIGNRVTQKTLLNYNNRQRTWYSSSTKRLSLKEEKAKKTLRNS